MSAALWLETLKLLVQVAWADHEVTRGEAELILGLAEREGCSADERAAIEQYLLGDRPLPAPDLGLLRAHRADVLRVVKVLIYADLRITDDEAQLLGELDTLLGAR